MKYTTIAPLSLLEALAQMSPESSKTTLRSWLKDGRVTVDGEVVKVADTRLKEGQEIALGVRPHFIKGGIRILYEDRHLVVIEKPEGLLSVATAFEKEETAYAFLKESYRPKHVYVVHRLDQDTSGVMLFALSEEAYSKLKVTFEKHEIERAYIAIVEGQVQQQSGSWESYVYEDANYVVHITDDPTKGRLATTHYAVKSTLKKYTGLDLKLETGRKNQIRVHCQAAGHPVVGDKKYGAKTDPIRRLCLHAYLLSFEHPITKKQMQFKSPIPEPFRSLM